MSLEDESEVWSYEWDPLPPYSYEWEGEIDSPVVICGPGGCTLRLTRVWDGQVVDELHLYSATVTKVVDPGVVCYDGPCSDGGGYAAYQLQAAPLPTEPVAIHRIPEPSGIVCALMVLLALAGWRRRWRKAE